MKEYIIYLNNRPCRVISNNSFKSIVDISFIYPERIGAKKLLEVQAFDAKLQGDELEIE